MIFNFLWSMDTTNYTKKGIKKYTNNIRIKIITCLRNNTATNNAKTLLTFCEEVNFDPKCNTISPWSPLLGEILCFFFFVHRPWGWLRVVGKGYSGHFGSLSLSNLNHFQFAYIFSSTLKGRASERCSNFRMVETAGNFCLYFFAISEASEYTLYHNQSNINSYNNKGHFGQKKMLTTSLFDRNKPGSLSSTAVLFATTFI